MLRKDDFIGLNACEAYDLLNEHNELDYLYQAYKLGYISRDMYLSVVCLKEVLNDSQGFKANRTLSYYDHH